MEWQCRIAHFAQNLQEFFYAWSVITDWRSCIGGNGANAAPFGLQNCKHGKKKEEIEKAPLLISKTTRRQTDRRVVRDIWWSGRVRLSSREQFNRKFRKMYLSKNGPSDRGTKYSDSWSQGFKSLCSAFLGCKALEGHCHKGSVGKDARKTHERTPLTRPRLDWVGPLLEPQQRISSLDTERSQ
jgi:hypothetical protein